MTCCALHNFLLEKDNLLVNLDGDIGLFDVDEELDKIPFSMRRLQNLSVRRNCDYSGMGPGDIDEADCDDEELVEGSTIDNAKLLGNVNINGVNDVHFLTSVFFAQS